MPAILARLPSIFDWVTQMEGKVPNHFYVEMNFPEFFKAKLGATKVLWQMGELTMEEIQLVGIAVSRANGCPYCTAAFCTILHHGLKVDEESVKQFVSDPLGAVLDDRTRSIVGFHSRRTHRSGALKALLQDHIPTIKPDQCTISSSGTQER